MQHLTVKVEKGKQERENLMTSLENKQASLGASGERATKLHEDLRVMQENYEVEKTQKESYQAFNHDLTKEI